MALFFKKKSAHKEEMGNYENLQKIAENEKNLNFFHFFRIISFLVDLHSEKN